MRKFTVIIPTWNMGRYLPALFESIVKSAFAEIVEEVIFVCEKSTDGSEAVIAELARTQGSQRPTVRMIQPEKRRGLFMARYMGAQAATTEKIFLIDSRITLPPRSGAALPRLAEEYPAMSANIDIEEQKNIFCLYWQRSHEAIFWRTYKANRGVNTVTRDNYDQFRIGGTCFYCSRQLYLACSEKYLASPLISDDTFLLKDMVVTEPITVHPDFRVTWEPRDTWKSFLKHLYQRGPGFAEYHVFEHRGWLFYGVLGGAFGLVALAVLLILHPLAAVAVAGAVLAGLSLSTALIVKGPIEFLRLAPLHVGVVLSYGFGALRGTWVIWKKRQRRAN